MRSLRDQIDRASPLVSAAQFRPAERKIHRHFLVLGIPSNLHKFEPSGSERATLRCFYMKRNLPTRRQVRNPSQRRRPRSARFLIHGTGIRNRHNSFRIHESCVSNPRLIALIEPSPIDLPLSAPISNRNALANRIHRNTHQINILKSLTGTVVPLPASRPLSSPSRPRSFRNASGAFDAPL